MSSSGDARALCTSHPGMDIMLVFGLNWMRYDKRSMSEKALGDGVGDAVAA